MKTGENRVSDARLLFPVLANQSPSGGRKFVYHVVDFLNQSGLDAWAVHPVGRFRLTWFENDTQVGYMPELFPQKASRNIYKRGKHWLRKRGSSTAWIEDGLRPKRLALSRNDILVVSETTLPAIHKMPNNKKLIFNQNQFFQFAGQFPTEFPPKQDYFGKDVLGMLVVSKSNYEFQKYMFPGVKILEAKLFVEDTFSHTEEKKLQIAYMPRRGKNDALAVLNMLRFKGLDKQLSVVAIDAMSHKKTAEILKESLIYLSFSNREGFGLPAAEAMACGCVVIGYAASGGEEFFNPSYCYPIQDGNLCDFVRAIEKVVHLFRFDASKLDEMRFKASQYIKENYSRNSSKESIVSAFQQFLYEE